MVEGSGGTLGAHTVILEACTALLQGTSPVPRRICPAMTQECLLGLGVRVHAHTHTHVCIHSPNHQCNNVKMFYTCCTVFLLSLSMVVLNSRD